MPSVFAMQPILFKPYVGQIKFVSTTYSHLYSIELCLQALSVLVAQIDLLTNARDVTRLKQVSVNSTDVQTLFTNLQPPGTDKLIQVSQLTF